MKRSALLLPPATASDSRQWLVLPQDADCTPATHLAAGSLRRVQSSAPKYFECHNPGGDLSTYATAILCLNAVLAELDAGDLASSIARHLQEMRSARALEAKLNTSDSLTGAVERNGDALAALRRISRESASSSTLIDQAARSLLAAFTALDYTHILVINAERIDRPSLKLLARSCLLTSVDAGLAWVWSESRIDLPDESRTVAARFSLPVHARTGILNAVKSVIQPREISVVSAGQPPPAVLVPRVSARGIGGATGWLANLNYDGCALWAAAQDKMSVDDCRLMAILMVNLGLNEAAIDSLKYAISICDDATLRCHMWYIAGLIWAKRRYDLGAANACFDTAEAALDAVRGDDPGDSAMERAWVENGRAMTAVLTARFAGKPITQAFPSAFEHLKTAFGLVRRGRTRDRVYLRYNLLGNMSSLMEIGGNRAVALELLNQTFDESLARGADNEREWLAQQRCMRAALMARSGQVAAAVPVFAEARALMQESNRPINAEALGRSQATALFQSGEYRAARKLFTTCLAEARRLRSRLGVETHATGIAACELAFGREQSARNILMEIGEEEGVWVLPRTELEAGAMDSLPVRDTYYGLSLSIPEVDLEDMAPASIAGVLHGRNSEIDTAKAQKV